MSYSLWNGVPLMGHREYHGKLWPVQLQPTPPLMSRLGLRLLALLMPHSDPGPPYRRGKCTQEQPVNYGRRKGGLAARPTHFRGSRRPSMGYTHTVYNFTLGASGAGHVAAGQPLEPAARVQ